MFKKAFWIPYEDSAEYPTMVKAMQAISETVKRTEIPVPLPVMMR